MVNPQIVTWVLLKRQCKPADTKAIGSALDSHYKVEPTKGHMDKLVLGMSSQQSKEEDGRHEAGFPFYGSSCLPSPQIDSSSKQDIEVS